ncbi:MAG: carbamoyl phosphate synthase large subunit [Acidimicrobiales bacterium]|nr:MAG: carbamoyl phosphate synthase large subunit [Acidimicrobiales bacterium]
MARRSDISSILVIGSGPIVIGQACEFDYSGTQACRVLAEEGYRVVLANSNPATIMTDPDLAAATYIEPLDAGVLTAIVERERPDAMLATLGGQTALNLAMALVERGVLDRYGVELIGASAEAIRTAEDRGRFKAAMTGIGLSVPASGFAHSLDEAMAVGREVGFPLIIRPSFILGGAGTGIATDADELRRLATKGLATSPVSEILVEHSIAGWKEYELEVMRDRADNCVVVCSIENLDPMGVHTGDSITVAPAQTLSDFEYQEMRDAAFACIRRIGVETGGSNIQFAVDPADGRMVVIEMNPRVSRSSALASKATGFPIAKIAARLAVGYTLDEITNDITGQTPACFEPTIDYVVTKVPRWAFEKFPGLSEVLGTRMQSVGEAMAIGRTFAESLQKALRSLDHGRWGLNCDPAEGALDALDDDELVRRAALATPDRPFQLEAALRRGVSVERLADVTRVDPWFLDQMGQISAERARLAELGSAGLAGLGRWDWRRAKRLGFSDAQLGWLLGSSEEDVRAARLGAGVRATFKTVDTCGAEFAASTPYHYSTYEEEDEVASSSRPRVVILGSGPNRIGQGIEFDYCCVHASFALREAGYETVMVNCNPETVSTDYDTSDRLYLEPLTDEDVANVLAAEQGASVDGGSVVGVIVALGGQTPLKLAGRLPAHLVLGTSPDSIDLAEDRQRWSELCSRLGIPQPPGGTARTLSEALEVVGRIGYPALVRPSYVLGGRAMEIVYDDQRLARAMAELSTFGATVGSLDREGGLSAERPVLVDRFLEDAIEVDVDAVRDATGEVVIGGVMEHVEEAGVHSGDSACVLPPPTLSSEAIEVIEDHTRTIAAALEVRGPLNVQFAVKADQVFVIEANPRASRTVPFVSKATGVPLAKVAARVMVGATLTQLRDEGLLRPPITGGHVSVKEAVLPFDRFSDVDSLLGPEMHSTGEVMGIDTTFGLAFAKSQMAAGSRLPESGSVFMSLAGRDKAGGVAVARRFVDLGFTIAATAGTAAHFDAHGVPVATVVAKVGGTGDVDDDEASPVAGGVDAVELVASGKVTLVVNTPHGRGPRADGAHIRAAASLHGVPCLTTLAAARAAAAGIADWAIHQLAVRPLQDYHRVDQPRLPL